MPVAESIKRFGFLVGSIKHSDFVHLLGVETRMNMRKSILSEVTLAAGFSGAWACVTLTMITDIMHRGLTRGLLGASAFVLVSLLLFAQHSAAFRAYTLRAANAADQRPTKKRVKRLWWESLLVGLGLCIVLATFLVIAGIRTKDIIDLVFFLVLVGLLVYTGIRFTTLYKSPPPVGDQASDAADPDSERRWSIGSVYLVFLPTYLFTLVGSMAFFGALYLSIRLGNPIYLLPLLVCSAGCFALAYRAIARALAAFGLQEK
jgi:hypothetical protein